MKDYLKFIIQKTLQTSDVAKHVIEYANSFNEEKNKKLDDDNLYYLVRLALRYYYYPCPEGNK